MRFKHPLSVISLCAVVAFSACAQNEALAAPQNTLGVSSVAQAPGPQLVTSETTRIIFLGDSLTAGFGLPRAQAWPEQVQQRLKNAGYQTEVINAGVSGNTTGQGLARYSLSVGPADADILVLALGVNDVFQGIAPGTVRQNLKSIIDRAQGDGMDVILAGVSVPQAASLGPLGRAYAAIYPELAGEYNLPFFPSIIDEVIGDPNLVQRDRIHPNQAGVRIMADNFTPFLISVLD